MKRTQQGFTLIELMIVVVIIGILAAIAIPNFVAMQDRAKEGSTKANMHTFQLAVEDLSVQNDGTYPAAAADVVNALPAAGANFKNPFDRTAASYFNDTYAAPFTPGDATPGIVCYGGTAGAYVIGGAGKTSPLTLQLSAGQ